MYPNLKEIQDKKYENRFSKKLSEKLNCEEINISQSGGSNDRIFRTTFDWIQSNKEKVKDTLFVVGLTTINRVDLYSKHDNRYIPAQPFYSGESIKLIITNQDSTGNGDKQYIIRRVYPHVIEWKDAYAY